MKYIQVKWTCGLPYSLSFPLQHKKNNIDHNPTSCYYRVLLICNRWKCMFIMTIRERRSITYYYLYYYYCFCVLRPTYCYRLATLSMTNDSLTIGTHDGHGACGSTVKASGCSELDFAVCFCYAWPNSLAAPGGDKSMEMASCIM